MQQNAVSPFFLDALKPYFYVARRKVNGGCCRSSEPCDVVNFSNDVQTNSLAPRSVALPPLVGVAGTIKFATVVSRDVGDRTIDQLADDKYDRSYSLSLNLHALPAPVASAAGAARSWTSDQGPQGVTIAG